MERLGEDFKETNTGALAMVLLEGQQQLGDDAHTYYTRLVRQLEADHKHVQHVQDFWGDPLTRGAAQSQDGSSRIRSGEPERQRRRGRGRRICGRS